MINGLLRLPDDNIEIIRKVNDFEDVVRERLGDDAGDMLRKIVAETEVAAHLAETDFASYEKALDAAMVGLRDLHDLAEELRHEIDRPRVNKAAVRALIDRMDTEISNHI